MTTVNFFFFLLGAITASVFIGVSATIGYHLERRKPQKYIKVNENS